MQKIKILFLSLIALVSGFFMNPNNRNVDSVLGATTVYTTDSTDTIGTFRTNVNTSLSNLANAVAGFSTTTDNIFTAGNIFQSSSTAMFFTMGNSTSTNATNTNLYISNDINVASGRAYLLNNTSVLSGTTLGTGVVNSSLTSVGTLSSLAVSGLSTQTGGILANNATSTITNLVTVLSTSTSATTTNLFSTTASTTNFFGAGLLGAGCSGSNFLQYSGATGRFECSVVSAVSTSYATSTALSVKDATTTPVISGQRYLVLATSDANQRSLGLFAKAPGFATATLSILKPCVSSEGADNIQCPFSFFGLYKAETTATTEFYISDQAGGNGYFFSSGLGEFLIIGLPN